MYTYKYTTVWALITIITVFSRVSAHLRVSAHPPFFDDPMVCVHMRYTYEWLLRINAHPVLAREFQAPMGDYSEDYGTCSC